MDARFSVEHVRYILKSPRSVYQYKGQRYRSSALAIVCFRIEPHLFNKDGFCSDLRLLDSSDAIK